MLHQLRKVAIFYNIRYLLGTNPIIQLYRLAANDASPGKKVAIFLL